MPEQRYPRFCSHGDTALVVELSAGIDLAGNRAVHRLDQALRADPPPGLLETVPSFRSVLLHYDPLATSHTALKEAVGARLGKIHEVADVGQDTRSFALPVCYEGDLAPDLDDVAERSGLSTDEVIARHQAGRYTVYMLGTFPGLAFMGDTDPRLHLPRRSNPRTRLPQGSVAITGQLTTIYPLASPGGWNLIGRSPVTLFDAQAEEPTLLRPGDQVRFTAVSRAEFARLADDPPAWPTWHEP